VRLPQSGVPDPSYYFESLGYMVPDRQLDPYFAEFIPGKSGAEPRPHQHFGCEFLFVLSGALEIRHGANIHRVDQGDAIYFDASTVHSYSCCGDTPATALIVTLQQPAPALDGNGSRSPSTAATLRPRSLPANTSRTQSAKPPVTRKAG
jgi:hypothetical protein